jgi:hypothetical protein
MDKIWYIFIDGKEEGPYSVKELLLHPRVTLDTLVWKEGFDQWIALRKVKELRRLFEKPEPKDEDEEQRKSKNLPPQEELVMEYGKDPNFLYIWVILAITLMIYLAYELYFQT